VTISTPASTPVSTYVIALGSNRRGRHGAPAREVRAAIDALGATVAISPLLTTEPLGSSRRRFVNAAAVIESDETPPQLLARLKRIERAFGRRAGRRWGARVIDLDIILWSGGIWADKTLTVPHRAFRNRDFVLIPLLRVVPAWRDPVTHRTVRQLAARASAVDRRPRRS
jgi:2-amino-4-hydroxy-6-hydroxymethyldihydropteridine diphosphokinase